ncbi:MAG: hypothetical protein JSV66_08175 [Trueperaceae bacterium]|nr:MAG: hypothetical protein JSV66_08175 [Trueperaceae bacterium]
MTTEKNEKLMEPKEEKKFFDGVFLGGLLLLAGLVFVLDSIGSLPRLGQGDAWTWLFLTAGLYGFVLIYVRSTTKLYRPATWWDYVFAGFLLLVGIGGFSGVELFWPLVILLLGMSILGENLWGKGKRQKPPPLKRSPE